MPRLQQMGFGFLILRLIEGGCELLQVFKSLSIRTKIMLAKFLNDGVIGPLRIGMSKPELISILGLPTTWEGQPGTMLAGKIIDPNESDAWIYNGVHVGIEKGVVDTLTIWMNYQPDFWWDHEWFHDWPLSLKPKLSDVRDYLVAHKIPYAITAKKGRFGFNIVMFESYVLGQALADAELGDIDVYGIIRVKDHNAVPSALDPSINVMKLRPKMSQP
jgi:hypothetical protein